jgi:hypothetical protein
MSFWYVTPVVIAAGALDVPEPLLHPAKSAAAPARVSANKSRMAVTRIAVPPRVKLQLTSSAIVDVDHAVESI